MSYKPELPSTMNGIRKTYLPLYPADQQWKLDIICRDYDLAMMHLFNWLQETDESGKMKHNFKKLHFNDYWPHEKNNLNALKKIFKTGKKKKVEKNAGN